MSPVTGQKIGLSVVVRRCGPDPRRAVGIVEGDRTVLVASLVPTAGRDPGPRLSRFHERR